MATDGERALRAAMETYGLGSHTEGILATCLPSIRLRGPTFEQEAAKSYRMPAPLGGLDAGVVAIATSGSHHLALLADGTVMAWGDNSHGQLGDGTRADRRRPVPVAGIEGAVAIAAALGYSVALLDDSSVVGWGWNVWGQLGGGPGPDRLTPDTVDGLDLDVVAIAADRNVRAIKADGSAWAIGNGAGDGLPHAAIKVATPPPGIRPGAWLDGVAACLDGSVIAWPGFTMAERPATVPDPSGVVQLAGERAYTVALREDGSVVAWGASYSRPLGDGTSSPSTQPVPVSGLAGGVIAVAAGSNCGVALKADGSAWAWGWGYNGQLGDGTSEDRLVPVPIPHLESDVTALAIGVALKADGSVWTWGGEVERGDPGLGDQLPIGATKLGGRPDLPLGAVWPAYESRPLEFMAQVRLADVAPHDPTGLLPVDGVLSFFFQHVQDPIGATASVVAYFPEGTPLARTEYPEELADHDRHEAVAVTPEVDATLHPDPPAFLDEADREPYMQMYYDEIEPGHRMLGYLYQIQGVPEPGADVLLLQLDFGDRVAFPDGAGLLYYLITEGDLRARRFDETIADYECT
ncbi:MAG TPA: DUF1963 domain-containing protein [Acidimicrobiales bacterium]|nr:DUF1963 domain-containing protein [Acidimicrobiales bacterium]